MRRESVVVDFRLPNSHSRLSICISTTLKSVETTMTNSNHSSPLIHFENVPCQEETSWVKDVDDTKRTRSTHTASTGFSLSMHSRCSPSDPNHSFRIHHDLPPLEEFEVDSDSNNSNELASSRCLGGRRSLMQTIHSTKSLNIQESDSDDGDDPFLVVTEVAGHKMDEFGSHKGKRWWPFKNGQSGEESKKEGTSMFIKSMPNTSEKEIGREYPSSPQKVSKVKHSSKKTNAGDVLAQIKKLLESVANDDDDVSDMKSLTSRSSSVIGSFRKIIPSKKKEEFKTSAEASLAKLRMLLMDDEEDDAKSDMKSVSSRSSVFGSFRKLMASTKKEESKTNAEASLAKLKMLLNDDGNNDEKSEAKSEPSSAMQGKDNDQQSLEVTPEQGSSNRLLLDDEDLIQTILKEALFREQNKSESSQRSGPRSSPSTRHTLEVTPKQGSSRKLSLDERPIRNSPRSSSSQRKTLEDTPKRRSSKRLSRDEDQEGSERKSSHRNSPRSSSSQRRTLEDAPKRRSSKRLSHDEDQEGIEREPSLRGGSRSSSSRRKTLEDTPKRRSSRRLSHDKDQDGREREPSLRGGSRSSSSRRPTLEATPNRRSIIKLLLGEDSQQEKCEKLCSSEKENTNERSRSRSRRSRSQTSSPRRSPRSHRSRVSSSQSPARRRRRGSRKSSSPGPLSDRSRKSSRHVGDSPRSSRSSSSHRRRSRLPAPPLLDTPSKSRRKPSIRKSSDELSILYYGDPCV